MLGEGHLRTEWSVAGAVADELAELQATMR
jgi:hypothetical protein